MSAWPAPARSAGVFDFAAAVEARARTRSSDTTAIRRMTGQCGSLRAIWWLLLIPAAVLAVMAVALTLLIRRARRIKAGIGAEVAAETVLIAPEPAVYRGGTKPYPSLKGNGIIALTRQRLVF